MGGAEGIEKWSNGEMEQWREDRLIDCLYLSIAPRTPWPPCETLPEGKARTKATVFAE